MTEHILLLRLQAMLKFLTTSQNSLPTCIENHFLFCGENVEDLFQMKLELAEKKSNTNKPLNVNKSQKLEEA